MESDVLPALLSPDGRGNECESWQDLLFWWIWPCCWRLAGRGWREVTQGLLLEGISFIRLLGEGRLALECTSLSTRRRKEGVIARSLPWLSRLRESSEGEGGKKKRQIQLQFNLCSSSGLRKHISSLYKPLDSLYPEMQHRTGMCIPRASLSREVAEPFPAWLPQRGAVGDRDGAR